MVATRTISAVTGTINQQVLGDTIKANLQTIGFTFLDDYISSTDRLLVFSLVLDASKTYGTIYLRIKITSALLVTASIGTAYNSSTKVLSNEGASSNGRSLSLATQLDVRTYVNAPEYRLLILSQGSSNTNLLVLGVVRPSYKPGWWDENVYPYSFIPSNVLNLNLNSFLCAALAPSSASLTLDAEISAKLGTLNSISLKRDLIPGLPLYLSNNQGIGGRLSEDFAAYAGSGTDKFGVAEIVAGQEEYDVFSVNSGTVVIRVL